MPNSYDAVRDVIAKVIPGFEDYNQKVRLPAGFYLPNGRAKVSFTETNGGVVDFNIADLPEQHDMAGRIPYDHHPQP
jgi:hypothetical protein